MEKVRADKEREVHLGHDGTWVAHPGLVPIAREIFERGMNGRSNQFEKTYEGTTITRENLLQVPTGTITEQGIYENVEVGIRYLAAWLSGNGCVAINGKMEDAATAEISRTQLWQWNHHDARTADGRSVREVYRGIIKDIEHQLPQDTTHRKATRLFLSMVENPQLGDFLTIPAYEQLFREEK